MSDYSKLDRLYHNIALGHNYIGELSFDIERALYKNIPHRKNATYVTGLARAGTTTLMRGLYSSNQFSSLTYNDMPFLLAPNLWGKISSLNHKKRLKKERAHGDGIQVDFDSPEALEEVFWRIYCDTDYILSDRLTVHEIPDNILKKIHRYQDLICYRHGKDRYLSKNNNHILRLSNIAERSQDTVFLVLFRDPLSQAESLMRQHKKFTNSDQFTKKYMTWLAHYEFGSTHRPFYFSKPNQLNHDMNTIEYWLQRWIDAYEYLLSVIRTGKGNIIAVSYEKLCNQEGYWSEPCDKLNVTGVESPFHMLGLTNPTVTNSPQLRDANEIYQSLLALKF